MLDSYDEIHVSFRRRIDSWSYISPLLACVLGPLAILLGIPGLTQRWRGYVVDDEVVETIPDPVLNIVLAAITLGAEVLANAVLMLRFNNIGLVITTRLSLALWAVKVIVALGNYVQFVVVHPQDGFIYLEGFWIGVVGVIISGIVIIFLTLNVIVTPPTRNVSAQQTAKLEQDRKAQRSFMMRVLILVVAMGLGSLLFSKIEGWSFVKGLYFVTATILTIGLGDVTCKHAASKVLLFPYIIFCICYLALLVSSLVNLIDDRLEAQRYIQEMEIDLSRMSTQERNGGGVHLPGSQAFSDVAYHRDADGKSPGGSATNSGSGDVGEATTTTATTTAAAGPADEKTLTRTRSRLSNTLPMSRTLTLQEEVERQALRRAKIKNRQQIRNVISASTFFLAFWCLGAMLFSLASGWSYGNGLYFGYIVLTTIGYGDFAPASQFARVAFIVYAIIAVPVITYLVQVFAEAMNLTSYIYNSKARRRQRIDRLDTRELYEIGDRTIAGGEVLAELDEDAISLADDDADGDNDLEAAIGTADDLARRRRARSMSQASLFEGRRRTLSRHALIERVKPRSTVLKVISTIEVPHDATVPHIDGGTLSSAEITPETIAQIDIDRLAHALMDREAAYRRNVLISLRKLDHLTRHAMKPLLHDEAELLLDLEMRRLDEHYARLLLRLRLDDASVVQEKLMDEAVLRQTAGLSGLERDRKFVALYRAAYAEVLGNVEDVVSMAEIAIIDDDNKARLLKLHRFAQKEAAQQQQQQQQQATTATATATMTATRATMPESETTKPASQQSDNTAQQIGTGSSNEEPDTPRQRTIRWT